MGIVAATEGMGALGISGGVRVGTEGRKRSIMSFPMLKLKTVSGD
jgi:hypothetical protein